MNHELREIPIPPTWESPHSRDLISSTPKQLNPIVWELPIVPMIISALSLPYINCKHLEWSLEPRLKDPQFKTNCHMLFFLGGEDLILNSPKGSRDPNTMVLGPSNHSRCLILGPNCHSVLIRLHSKPA